MTLYISQKKQLITKGDSFDFKRNPILSTYAMKIRRYLASSSSTEGLPNIYMYVWVVCLIKKEGNATG